MQLLRTGQPTANAIGTEIDDLRNEFWEYCESSGLAVADPAMAEPEHRRLGHADGARVQGGTGRVKGGQGLVGVNQDAGAAQGAMVVGISTSHELLLLLEIRMSCPRGRVV